MNLALIAYNLQKRRWQGCLDAGDSIQLIITSTELACLAQRRQRGQERRTSTRDKSASIGLFQDTERFVNLPFLRLQFLFRMCAKPENTNTTSQSGQANAQEIPLAGIRS